MSKVRLDQALTAKGLVTSRSQAESYIKLGQVLVDGQIVTKAGQLVKSNSEVRVTTKQQYVSRAALKLDSVASALKLDFKDKVVLDVGSSTGGFTDYAVKHGAKKVIAVEQGSNQLHPNLRGNPKIELHEQTDISDINELSQPADMVVIDVSFVSLRDILPTVAGLSSNQTQIIAMVKPQFEAKQEQFKHKGVIKNDNLRRQILKDFELWVQTRFVVKAKADSEIRGAKGNLERFYDLRKA
ncbi:MAG TPA: TlyA family RNA methyltransferase [Candidatus Saccharimonadales bacterium]|nr:TlyA family RNA methyltransferase [Candidatus Saccharimonadales bacterium]